MSKATTVMVLLLLSNVPLLGQPSSGSSKSSSAASQQQAGSPSGSAPASSGNAPFETQMLAYGAADEIVENVLSEARKKVKCSAPSETPCTVVIYDQVGFAAMGQFQGFTIAIGLLAKSYQDLAASLSEVPPAPLAAAAGVPTPPLVAIAPQIATLLQAGAQESPASVTISNTALALTALHLLNESHLCPGSANERLIYPPLDVSLDKSADTMMTKVLGELAASKARVAAYIAKIDPAKATDKQKAAQSLYAQLEQTLGTVITTYLSPDPLTGLPGYVSLIQGAKLLSILNLNVEDKSRVFVVYMSAVAGGGTQRVRKNLFTNIFWGDIITYSGGAVVAAALVEEVAKGSEGVREPTVLWANTVRYRTPVTRIGNPSGDVKKAKRGDNFEGHGDKER